MDNPAFRDRIHQDRSEVPVFFQPIYEPLVEAPVAPGGQLGA
jgi:hypothetical protein